jgi:hypothetical protein
MQPPLEIPSQTVDCSTIQFTNLCFNEEHAALKSLIFWAIFHETSEDRFFSGQDEIVASTLDETNVRAYSSFLASPPYCDNGVNNEPSEDITTDNWNDQNQYITLVSHCYDHRYLEAQTIINRFLNYERRFDYDANNPATLMSQSFKTMRAGFITLFTSSDHALWQLAGICINNQNILPPDAVRLPTRGENFYPTQDPSNDWDSDPNDSEPYSFRTIIEAISNSPATGSNQQAAWRWMAVRWLDGYLSCINTLPLSYFGQTTPYLVTRVREVYPRIMGQINQAIEDMYLQVPDFTNAAFDLKAANVEFTSEIKTISLCIGGCGVDTHGRGYFLEPINSVTQQEVRDSYHTSPSQILSCLTPEDIEEYDDNISMRDHIDQVRNCYTPGWPTVLQPVLVLDAPRGNPGGYQWQTLVYQQTDTQNHDPRYSVDICQLPTVDIANCQ